MSRRKELRQVVEKSGIVASDDALELILDVSDSPIEDLKSIIKVEKTLTADDVHSGGREQESNIFEMLDVIYKSGTGEDAVEISFEVDMTPPDLIQWVEENVPNVYSGEELARAYRYLQKADIWLKRTMDTQQYGFWRYAGSFTTAGVAASRDESKSGWTSYSSPSTWGLKSQNRSRRNTENAISRKIGERVGVSMKEINRVFPYIDMIIEDCGPEFAGYYMLNEKEAEFLDIDEIIHPDVKPRELGTVPKQDQVEDNDNDDEEKVEQDHTGSPTGFDIY